MFLPYWYLKIGAIYIFLIYLSLYISIYFNIYLYIDRYICFNKFIYLFLAALGLHCCTWAFSSCGEPGLLFLAARGLLIAVASLVAEHGL